MPALLLLLAGCANVPPTASDPGAEPVSLELTGTPFYPQERYQCGPAALTTILEASGADVTLDEIVRKVYLPGRRGSLQLEMLAATRTSGRIPYVIDPSLAAIVAELDAGRPVVVLQNLGVGILPRWHYAVVIGVDTDKDLVVLRSGTDRRRETDIDVFLRTWSRGEFWGIVTLRPDELPARVDRLRYISAIAALEQANRLAEAETAWQAALRQWPDDTTALFGLANVNLALERFAEAERTYRALLDMRPDMTVARNNLALAIAGQGRLTDALAEIEFAIETNRDHDLEAVLRDSKQEIETLRD